MTRARKRKVRPRRKTFVIDHDTLTDIGLVQKALRATSAAEAVRVSVRRMADLIRQADAGNAIQVVYPNQNAPLVLDIPRSVSPND